MAFGSFNKESAGAPMAEINMVPLIDVMLVLLVIFILTAPLLTHAVKVELPRASSTENKSVAQKIEIAINEQGALYWNGELVSETRLDELLLAAGKASEQGAADLPEVHLRADRNTPYEAIARVMAASARAGLGKLAFVSNPSL